MRGKGKREREGHRVPSPPPPPPPPPLSPFPFPFSPTPSGVHLSLHAQPRASRTEVAGLHGSRLRIRLAAPPVDGAANEELIRFLAETLGVRKDAVRIVSGHSSRQKTVEVAGLTVEEAARRLRVEEE